MILCHFMKSNYSFPLCLDAKWSKNQEKMIAHAQAGSRSPTNQPVRNEGVSVPSPNVDLPHLNPTFFKSGLRSVTHAFFQCSPPKAAVSLGDSWSYVHNNIRFWTIYSVHHFCTSLSSKGCSRIILQMFNRTTALAGTGLYFLMREIIEGPGKKKINMKVGVGVKYFLLTFLVLVQPGRGL